MAKNKKQNSKGQKPMTDKRFLAEKANKLPVGKCYITPNWEESGEAHIIITRKRGNGNLCVGHFLVDTWCVGVKDAFGTVDQDPSEFEEILNRSGELAETDYPTVHNIIYGAVEFAGEAGIEPHPSYWTWQPMLEEDSDDVPFIDIEFGHEGKYVLIARQGSREALLVPELIKRLGTRFNYSIGNPNDEDFDDPTAGMSEKEYAEFMRHMEEIRKEDERNPDEPFHYDYPSYPDSPEGNYPFIAETLLEPANLNSLPEGFIEKIDALPLEKAVEDISKVALYTIGKTYPAINDGSLEEPEDGSILHAAVLLAHLKDKRGLYTILEILRQNDDFMDIHLGDFGRDLLPEVIYQIGQESKQCIEEFLYIPGIFHDNKDVAVAALAQMVLGQPESRAEVIEIFRRYLNAMIDNLPQQKGCDAVLAGYLMSHLMDIKAVELIPEIKRVFETHLVNRMIAGDCDEVVTYIESDTEPMKEFTEEDPLEVYKYLQD